MEEEQKNLPYFDVTEIEIIESKDDIVKYRVKISSRYNSKWSMWEPVNTINTSTLITELREEKLKLLLNFEK
jgi:hypothetical protein